ncbi:MAG TPA: quaternary ammonium compound efflux SMR transporter SugE, partial [Bryobacteraceae bacterium]|nr:quaternary ammonium compound efflux SMR transporter SugE [Bryobacteraceae bacterium]
LHREWPLSRQSDRGCNRCGAAVVNAWALLLIAGLLETVWAVGLRYSQGFTRLWPSIWTAAAMVASFWLLSQAIKVLPLGTAYAVWTGIGAAGAVLFGIVFFGEPATAIRLLCVGLIIVGILGLKLTGGHG